MLRTRGRRRSKATVMLEFALVAPFFLLFVVIMIDVSRMLLIQNAVQDATFASARAGAQIGYGSGTDARDKARAAFDQSVAARFGWLDSAAWSVLDECTNPADPYFQVNVAYDIDLLFPRILGFPNNVESSTNGLSRCEIVRG